jgi:integrase
MGRGPGIRAVGPEAIQIDFRWRGIRCRERLRLKPTPANLKFATRLKATIEHEIATGTFDYAKHFPDSDRARKLASAGSSLPLRTALRGYVASLAGSVEPETLREYGNDAETIAEGLGNPSISRLTKAQVRDWIATLQLSKSRLDNLLRPLRGLLRQALDDGLITKNPLEGFQIRRVGENREIVDPFTPAEVTALGKVEGGELWTFWAWTGLRSGEVIGLLWGDVAAQCESVTVRRAVRRGREKATKTAAGFRVLQLLAPARAALRGLRSAGDDDGALPVFRNPNTSRGWHEAKALNRAFARACRDAGVRRRYVYQLRHTFATWALSSGENPLWVAKQMGHTDVKVLYEHYGRWMPQLDTEAGSRMVSKARRGQRAA